MATPMKTLAIFTPILTLLACIYAQYIQPMIDTIIAAIKAVL
jgi:hypothetical protein